MITTMNEFTLCPHCGSDEYLENYPTQGISSCTKCGHEVAKILLKEMTEEEILQQNCPFCEKEGEEDDALFDEDGIMVFKCKGCGKLDGYVVTPQPILKISYEPKAVSLDKLEGNLPVYSEERAREIARAIKKAEKDPKKLCQKQFKKLVNKKQYVLQQNGVGSKIMEKAILEASVFINLKGPFTDKQLESLLSAAITLIQEDLTRMGNSEVTTVTERQMEKIFDVDRKTMRKWKKVLRENCSPQQLIVYAHLGIEESADWKVEIPKDLQAIRKIENPKEGKCDFCETNKLLVLQLEYRAARWNKICIESYERLKQLALKENWNIPNLND